MLSTAMSHDKTIKRNTKKMSTASGVKRIMTPKDVLHTTVKDMRNMIAKTAIKIKK